MTAPERTAGCFADDFAQGPGEAPPAWLERLLSAGVRDLTDERRVDLARHIREAQGAAGLVEPAPSTRPPEAVADSLIDVDQASSGPRHGNERLPMSPATSDLCDAHGDAVRVVALIFRDFGGRRRFAGPIATVKVHEDNVLVRAALEQAGGGRVLVIDGGGSLRCALVGDQIADLARRNGWAGLVIHGAVRDAEAVGAIDVGVKALAACPRKSGKRGWGERDAPVHFGGVTFVPGEWLAADADGIVVAAAPLD